MPHPAPTTPASHTATTDDAQDLKLVEAIRRGEQSAWAILITKHQDRLFATCLRMVHNRDLAADLAQDSFVKIIQGIDSFDGRAKLSTWMIRITMNVCFSKLRSEKVRRHVSLDALTDRSDGANDGGRRAMEFSGGREPAAASSVEAHEDRDRVLEALRLLDPDQRAVIILCDAQGHSYDQIAEVLGVATEFFKRHAAETPTADGVLQAACEWSGCFVAYGGRRLCPGCGDRCTHGQGRGREEVSAVHG